MPIATISTSSQHRYRSCYSPSSTYSRSSSLDRSPSLSRSSTYNNNNSHYSSTTLDNGYSTSSSSSPYISSTAKSSYNFSSTRPPRPSESSTRRTLENLRNGVNGSGGVRASINISSPKSSTLRSVLPQYSRNGKFNRSDAYCSNDLTYPVLTRYRDLNSSPTESSVSSSLDKANLTTRRSSLNDSSDSNLNDITARIRIRPPSPSEDSSSIGSTNSSDNNSGDNCSSLTRRRKQLSEYENRDGKRYDSNANLYWSGSSAEDDDSGIGSTNGSRPSSRSSNGGSLTNTASRYIKRNSLPLSSNLNIKDEPGIVGLRNLGNTCFMNSVIQCLSNTRPLQQYCIRDRYMSDINTFTSPMKGSLIKTFASLLQSIWKNVDNESCISPSDFKNQIQRFASKFVGYNQQDAQEFLRYLLQGLHEDVNRITTRSKSYGTQINDDLSDKQKASQSWNRYLRIDDSKIVDLFVGQLKSTLKCTVCGHMSVTFDPFWDLSLPIPKTVGEVSIQQCLNLFTKEETLEGDEKPTCAKCKERRKCTKSLTIWKFPKILVLHLKRFSPHERFRAKLNSTVNCPINNLDLSPYGANSNRGDNLVYNLYAVSNHSGSTYSGHYTAYCKHPISGIWHDFSDSSVSEISGKNKIMTNEAYVLFYESASDSLRL